jgi:hypothetical protein
VTGPEAAKAARSFAMPVVLGSCALGIAVNFALLIPTLKRQGEQAREGQRARTTQCRTFPISTKLYTAAAKYRLITRDDLATYLAAAPRGCPPPKLP